MKLCVIIFVFFTSSVFAFAKENDSVQVAADYDLLLIGGVGITTPAIFYESDRFDIGPAFALGAEIPITQAHIFAVQLYSHIWIAESRFKAPEYSMEEWLSRNYNMLSKYTASQMSLSLLLKYYIGDKDGKVRMSFQLGRSIFCTNPDYLVAEFGLSIYYTINIKWVVSASYRSNLGHPNVGGGSDPEPNLLMLNTYYKLDW